MSRSTEAVAMITVVIGGTCSFPIGCSPEVKKDGGSDISQLSSGIPG